MLPVWIIWRLNNQINSFYVCTSTRGNTVVGLAQVQTCCYYLGTRVLVSKTVNGKTKWMGCIDS